MDGSEMSGPAVYLPINIICNKHGAISNTYSDIRTAATPTESETLRGHSLSRSDGRDAANLTANTGPREHV